MYLQPGVIQTIVNCHSLPVEKKCKIMVYHEACKQTLKSKPKPPINTANILRSPDQESSDEVLGLGGDLRKRLLSELPVTAGDVL